MSDNNPRENPARNCFAQGRDNYSPHVILVTGAAGYIGSNFVNFVLNLTDCQVKVVAFDRLDYCSRVDNWVPKLAVAPRFTFVRGDLTDTALLTTLLQEHRVDTVVHFAAQTHVDNSFTGVSRISPSTPGRHDVERPDKFWDDASFQTQNVPCTCHVGDRCHLELCRGWGPGQFVIDNVLGTTSLLEACRTWGKIGRFVHISTDEVYGDRPRRETGSRESDPLHPTNPYAASKAGAEFVALSYMASFGIPVVITRGNNVFGSSSGAHQFPEKIVPKFAMLLLRNLRLPIHGRGDSRRNFIHVEDTCRAVWVVMERGLAGEAYNIGTDNELTVLEMAGKLVKLVHGQEANPKDHFDFVADRPYNDCRYHLDSTKLRGLGWEEEQDFEAGLKETVEWFRRHGGEFSYDAAKGEFRFRDRV
jgi:dTDP-glucose 4,6-dehydratase